MAEGVLRSHAILDCESRIKKAKKIELLVAKVHELKRSNMLEVGCGSGQIASYFSESGYGRDGCYAVDVVDERQVEDDFQFELVDGTTLPFKDGVFDFIISNHVIEHVGDSVAQKRHLEEIFRCLAPGEVFYFAVPNRWRLIEPHYKLPLLSWLPNKFASVYVRLFRLATRYDCNPLSAYEATDLLERAGFEPRNVTLDAIPLVCEIEGGIFMRALAKLPRWFWDIFSSLVPTLIYICRKP